MWKFWRIYCGLRPHFRRGACALNVKTYSCFAPAAFDTLALITRTLLERRRQSRPAGHRTEASAPPPARRGRGPQPWPARAPTRSHAPGALPGPARASVLPRPPAPASGHLSAAHAPPTRQEGMVGPPAPPVFPLFCPVLRLILHKD